MAQSALTVTPSNPTPPTNFSFLGTTPPTAPAQLAVDDGAAGPLTAFAAKLASVDNANFPSLDAEGRGTEVVVTQTYSPSTFLRPGHGTVSDLGSYTTTPNAQHASACRRPSILRRPAWARRAPPRASATPRKPSSEPASPSSLRCSSMA